MSILQWVWGQYKKIPQWFHCFLNLLFTSHQDNACATCSASEALTEDRVSSWGGRLFIIPPQHIQIGSKIIVLPFYQWIGENWAMFNIVQYCSILFNIQYIQVYRYIRLVTSHEKKKKKKTYISKWFKVTKLVVRLMHFKSSYFA